MTSTANFTLFLRTSLLSEHLLWLPLIFLCLQRFTFPSYEASYLFLRNEYTVLSKLLESTSEHALTDKTGALKKYFGNIRHSMPRARGKPNSSYNNKIQIRSC